MLSPSLSNALFDTLKEVHFIYEPLALWQFALEKACKTLQAEAGTFYEHFPDGQQLKVAASYGMDSKRLGELSFPLGGGIAGWVAQYSQPALVNDVRQDPRFTHRVDLVTGFHTQSILCVPVFSQKHHYGVLEIFNKKNNQFTPQDQEFMTLLGRQTAVAYQNLQLFAEVQRSKVLMESLVENLSGGLIAFDTAGMITVMNPAAIRLLQLPTDSAAGRPVAEVLKDHPWFVETLKKTLETQATVSRQETSLDLHGETCRLGYTTILIADRQKQLLGAGIIFQKLNPR